MSCLRLGLVVSFRCDSSQPRNTRLHSGGDSPKIQGPKWCNINTQGLVFKERRGTDDPARNFGIGGHTCLN